ncbi:NAD(P)-dependent oxidoreductase [Hydrogenophaga crassostreae]|uniref:NAD(P)-dependent oxidoreductase n=1 Tax=Hydrogenophaga crassostreae TaxID=1763535 RepID=A0A162VSV5_9BURK|nr:SDR family oxidoreductase [Hydrogenophaga crassostreae]AOW13032.1 NAD(P)-dependent oxidoreductase [Hydrogenophaga crassostreae]OAD40216.1 NAD(P)-dependent oxidoreductase [Hydrogenophaga crassostreae]
MIVITGATGQLGRLVIQNLLKTTPAAHIVAAVRSPEKARDLAAQGVVVRQADYTQPASLVAAFQGAEKVLLISSSEVGQRLPQHQAVIEAAAKAGVKLVAYTSILHADTSPLGLADEHKATEALLTKSGLPHVLLRNGWYTENYVGSAPAAAAHGAVLGAAKDGRIASAARADYAAAAAAVLVAQDQAGKVYELAGDTSYTLTELATEIARQSGKPVAYQDMPQAASAEALASMGLPAGLAQMLAESDVGASKGGLFDDSKQLSQLIGRPTTPLAESVKQALAG